MKPNTNTIARATGALCLTALALACRASEPQAAANADAPAARWSDLPEPALYARDGTVVQGTRPEGAPGGNAASEPRHDVAARDGSRMYLLELYQKAVEDKEGLAREVQGLQSAVSRAGETQAAIAEERDEARALAARLAKELEQARADNTELAARLVTAQIRRLEAERLLLEARLEALRRDASSPGGVPIETSAPRSGPPSKDASGGPGAERAHGGGHE